MATIKTGSGVNNKSSHVVGYENNRFRTETFTFTVPDTTSEGIPILKAQITAGTFSGKSSTITLGGGTAPTMYFYIDDVQYGTLSKSSTYLKLVFSNNCELTPGTHKLVVKTTATKLGWYYFPNSNKAMTIDLTADYIIAGVAYINNEPYQCYIGDGTDWVPYSIHIGDDTNWIDCGV